MQIYCSFTSVILAGQYDCKTTLTQHHKNALKKHVLTAECRMAELFTNGTAHDIWQFTTILQTVFMWHSNFSDFWVAPCIFSSWNCVQLPSIELVMAFDPEIQARGQNEGNRGDRIFIINYD